MPCVEQGHRARVVDRLSDDLFVGDRPPEVKRLEIRQIGEPLAHIGRFVAAELQVQSPNRGTRGINRCGIRVDENPKDRTEGRKARDDSRGSLDRDLPLAGRKDEAKRVDAGRERLRCILIRGAAANFDSRQRTGDAGIALIPPISAAGSSTRIRASPIRKPRAPAAISSRASPGT
jgi:hypothetical protein